MLSSTVDILIVSGRSGSGKTSALNVLQDFGYYAIDNLPLSLVADAATKLIEDSGIHKIALGIDIRTPRADLSNFKKTYNSLGATYGVSSVRVLYLTAQEPVLIARFDATRRVHPLMAQVNGQSVLNQCLNSQKNEPISNLPSAINTEIELLEPIAGQADIKIDTSTLNTHQLKERIREHIGLDNFVTVNILSFGFKYGLPIDADFVFDVRILPNPHWQPELRVLNGQDEVVKDFFAQHIEVAEMQQDIYRYLDRWLPEFLNNNRHTVTIAIGCTGGKHRSVYLTDAIGAALSVSLPAQLKVAIKHREKAQWPV